MKKLLAILLICVIALFVTACGNDAASSKDETKESEISSTEVEETEEEETEELELMNDGEYVIVAMKESAISIASEADFSNYSIGYIDETDGMRYAEYYDFASTGLYNGGNDLHSGIMGGTVDLAIIDKSLVANYDDWEVVWEMK